MTSLFDFAVPDSQLRWTRHKAGDHSLCNPASPRHGICSQCGKTVQVTSSSAPAERRRCRDCQRANPKERQLDPRVCDLCECEYVPKPMHRPGQRWCSKSCAQAWRNGARPPYNCQLTKIERQAAVTRAKRLRHAETWDGITDEEILERDDWRCQIPGCKRRPIRKDVKYPHSRSKSIDHIIPLSLGGDDTAANKRAAHLGCNLARGNQMTGTEQVALFGVVREPPLATATAGERAVMFQRRKRVCACGDVPLNGKKFCQRCLKQRQADIERRKAEAEERRAAQLTPLHYYNCRYCGELKVARGGGRYLREVCPARDCHLARLASNHYMDDGMAREQADALVKAIMADGIRLADGRRQWRTQGRPRGTASRPS